MIREIARRIQTLEQASRRPLTETEMAFISDEDLEWLVSRPAHVDQGRFDFNRWTPEDFSRAEAIWRQAVAAAAASSQSEVQ